MNELKKLADRLKPTDKMPVLFVGHGNPMNAVEENLFVEGFRKMGQRLPRPQAIICVSAHWFTRGTLITAMPQPKTIHDFYGFPQELYQQQYPAPGFPELASATKEALASNPVNLDHDWGFDHGTWTVLKHMFPEAKIPVIQISIDYSRGPEYHFSLARQLAAFRERGVLIIGSGNIVHNLQLVDFANINKVNYGFDWAIEAREILNQYILEGNFKSLINYQNLGQAVKLAVPTPEHYLPLLYSLGLKEKSDELELFNDKLLAGSLSMTSLKLG